MKTLKEAREEKGIKQAAVADAIHITRQTYAKYEDNPRIMTVEQAKAACDFIGCDFADIFFGNGVSAAKQHED